MSEVIELSSQELIALEQQYGAHNYKPLDVVLSEGQGVWVWDVEGNRYLDCLSAYSAVNQGHAHPRIREALVAQAARLPLTSRAFYNDQLGLFYKQVCELTGYEMMLPMNTGAEAVETALKAARKWGYKIKGVPDGQAEIIACAGNFAGRTISIISFSTEDQYRDGFGPFTPGFKTIPYGDAQALEAAITPNTVAFIVEPVQGEGGVRPLDDGFLRFLRERTEEAGAALIFDEVQCGLGRTGRLFAHEEAGVVPDLMTLAKPLAGGLPMGAVLLSGRIAEAVRPGDHATTFGGGPLVSAVALAVVRRIAEPAFLESVRASGERVREVLEPRAGRGGVVSVRGRGLMWGIELDGPAAPIVSAALDRGLLITTAGERVVRLLPPLTIEPAELDEGLDVLLEVLG